MMMPFVAARRAPPRTWLVVECAHRLFTLSAVNKAPPGTVLVVEVGVIDVRRDNGKRREVDDFLWSKNRAEKAQIKLDRREEQKLMRLRARGRAWKSM